MMVTFIGKGDYEGTETFVDGIKIRKAKATIKDQVLDPLHMDPQKMEETVVLEAGDGIPEKTLTRGTDYIVDGAMYELVPGETTAVIMAYNRGDYVGYFNVPCTFLPTPMSSVSIKLPAAAYTFTGKAITPAPVVTFKSSNGRTMTLKNGTDYTVSYAGNVNAGTATVKVTGKGRFSGVKSATFRINKAANTLSVKAKTATLKAKKLKKKKQLLAVKKILTVNNAKGTLSYKIKKVSKSKYKKYFAMNARTGKLTVKKKLKKGTYKVNVAVTASGDANHNAATKQVTFRIKVK